MRPTECWTWGLHRRLIRSSTALPEERQTLLFSATMPTDLRPLGEASVNDPVRVMVTSLATTAEGVTSSAASYDLTPVRQIYSSRCWRRTRRPSLYLPGPRIGRIVLGVTLEPAGTALASCTVIEVFLSAEVPRMGLSEGKSNARRDGYCRPGD